MVVELTCVAALNRVALPILSSELELALNVDNITNAARLDHEKQKAVQPSLRNAGSSPIGDHRFLQYAMRLENAPVRATNNLFR